MHLIYSLITVNYLLFQLQNNKCYLLTPTHFSGHATEIYIDIYYLVSFA